MFGFLVFRFILFFIIQIKFIPSLSDVFTDHNKGKLFLNIFAIVCSTILCVFTFTYISILQVAGRLAGVSEDIPDFPNAELSEALQTFLRVPAFVATGDGKARGAPRSLSQTKGPPRPLAYWAIGLICSFSQT